MVDIFDSLPLRAIGPWTAFPWLRFRPTAVLDDGPRCPYRGPFGPTAAWPVDRRSRMADRGQADRPAGQQAVSAVTSIEHLVEYRRPARYTPASRDRRRPSRRAAADPIRSPRSRPPSATGSRRASRRRPTRRSRGWAAIAGGHHTLIHAPTGSGKTLAAFLWCLDRLATRPDARRDPRGQPGTVRVLYVSPLKALTYDVERNLRAPLTGIGLAAQRLGEPVPHDHGRQPDGRHAQPRTAARSPGTRRTS